MDYKRIVKGILDIGEELLRSGAENFRLDDSIYRMCAAYGFKQYDVFAIPSNIQITVETQDGEFITQIRHIETLDVNLDRLDKLNNLCRYVCANTPDEDELRAKFRDIMSEKEQPVALQYLAKIVAGSAFAVFFGADVYGAILAAILAAIMTYAGQKLSKHEHNLLVYNTILSFVASAILILLIRGGLQVSEESIMTGLVMLLISALSTTNGIRELLQRDYISGTINVMNSILGALGIAVGIALAMTLMYEGAIAEAGTMAPSPLVQLISCTIGCIGFAFMFKIRTRQVLYSGIGAFFTYAIYLITYHFMPSNFFATLMGAVFVALYAFAMSRLMRVASTIFLTASVFPLIPGAALYYTMYGFVTQDYNMGMQQGFALITTCLGIAFGFLIVDVITRTAMNMLQRDYHIGKNSILHIK